LKPTAERTPRAAAASAAATIARACATLLASGFSHSTCLPAASAAIAIAAWLDPGVHTSTSWTSSRATSFSQSVSVDRQPSFAAAAATRSGSRPQTAARSTSSGSSKNRLADRQAWEWAAPMKA
jgi:hypothetical protein